MNSLSDEDNDKHKVAEFLRQVQDLPGGMQGITGQDAEKLAIRFLRARKMDVARAIQVYRQHNRMRYSENIGSIDPSDDGVHRELISGKFTVLPSRDSHGAAILVFTARLHWPPISTHRDTLKMILLQLDAVTQDESTQRNGLIFIYDMADSRYANFDHHLCERLLHLLKGAYPARLRKVFILSSPFWFRMPYEALKFILKEKMRERVQVISRDQLTNHIDPSCLPATFGGTLPPPAPEDGVFCSPTSSATTYHYRWLRECFALLQVEDRISPNYFHLAPPASPSLASARHYYGTTGSASVQPHHKSFSISGSEQSLGGLFGRGMSYHQSLRRPRRTSSFATGHPTVNTNTSAIPESVESRHRNANDAYKSNSSSVSKNNTSQGQTVNPAIRRNTGSRILSCLPASSQALLDKEKFTTSLDTGSFIHAKRHPNRKCRVVENAYDDDNNNNTTSPTSEGSNGVFFNDPDANLLVGSISSGQRRYNTGGKHSRVGPESTSVNNSSGEVNNYGVLSTSSVHSSSSGTSTPSISMGSRIAARLSNASNSHFPEGESIFQPFPSGSRDCGMTIIEFANHVRKLGDDGLMNEFQQHFATRDTEDCAAFKNPANKKKNRYVDVYCIESSRVKLPENRYIHANWVDGYKQKNAFICTQGPLPETCDDFWLMVWEYGVPIIVMTTKTFESRRQKCHQYWPGEIGEKEKFGPFTITNVNSTDNGIYRKSVLTIKNKNSKSKSDTRQILHYYFNSWPDFGIPDTAAGFLTYLKDVAKEREEAMMASGVAAPVLVHCSAGIGRTGTFIAMDICIRQLADQGLVDLRCTVLALRTQRCGSIQMPQQYVFCHKALLEHAKAARLID